MNVTICRRTIMHVKDGIKSVARNGGATFTPYYKKDIKPFKMRVKYAVNRSALIVSDSPYQFPLN